MRIAYFSPLNPIKSGVSDYSEELLPYLSHHADIDLYIDNYLPSNKDIREKFNIYHYLTFEDKYNDYDITLYHIGNNPAHTYIYNCLMKYPGVVVLHDFLVHHLALKALVDGGSWEEYMKDMRRYYGDVGALASIQILKGYGRDTLYFLYPFNENLLSQVAGVIVHSDYLKKTIHKKFPQLLVAQVNQGIKLRQDDEINLPEAKRRLGLKNDTFVISSFGFITPSKKPETMLKAFKAFHGKHNNSFLLLVGKVADDLDIQGLIKKYSLKRSVKVTGYVDFDHFQEYIRMSDVCLNLRYPSGGETSAALLRIMAFGKAVVVSNYNQFAELPDHCCVKVDLGRNEIPQLIAYLNLLLEDKNLRLQIGLNAREYIRQNHTLELSARQYAKCLTRFKPAIRKKREMGQLTLRNRQKDFSLQLITELMGEMDNLSISDKAESYLKSIVSGLDIMPE